MLKKEEILNILSKYVEIDISQLINISETTKLEEIGLHSLQFVQFIVDVEEFFSIEIDDCDLLISKFENLGKVYEIIEKYLLTKTIKKVLVCDCDNCLWDGIAGEEEVSLSKENVYFQNKIVELYNRGVLICICSKNMPQNIWQTFEKLKMPLKKEYIVESRINYKNKAENILEIAERLNLFTDSFVFIDDSAYEIETIHRHLPDVLTIKVDHPNNTNDVIEALENSFSSFSTIDDRTRLYREQKEREKIRIKYDSKKEYNDLLNTEINCEKAKYNHLARISELSLRTNQFNLSAKRYTEQQLMEICIDSSKIIFSVSIKDKYGDMGIVAAAVVNTKKSLIESFFVSCRAFDRDVEIYLLKEIRKYCPGNLYGIYIKNDKNIRFENFYRENGVSLCEEV